jgi:hypothetical protein
MDQDHRLPATVVLIVEIDVAGVFLADIDKGHETLLSVVLQVAGFFG